MMRKKIDKAKVLSIAGIVLTTVISTLLSTAMQDKEIDKAVQRHLSTDNNEEEA